MTNLVDLTAVERAHVDARSRVVCVVFSEQALPEGSVSPRGRVGIEAKDGEVRLLVAPRTHYVGLDSEVGAWLASGVVSFARAAVLWDWVDAHLASPVVENGSWIVEVWYRNGRVVRSRVDTARGARLCRSAALRREVVAGVTVRRGATLTA